MLVLLGASYVYIGEYVWVKTCVCVIPLEDEVGYVSIHIELHFG